MPPLCTLALAGAMQDLYAARLVIPGADVAGLERTISDWAARRPLPDIAEDWNGRRTTEVAPGRVVTRERLELDDLRGFSLVLRHPDDAEPTALAWATTVEVTREGDAPAIVTVRVTREATEHRIAPARLDLRPPGLVLTLLRTAHCMDGRTRIVADGRMLAVDEVEGFVVTTLQDEERRLPALLVATADPFAAFAAERVAALAHVVYVDREAWNRLNDVAPLLAPMWHGARLVWPLPWSERLAHNSYLPSDVKAITPFRNRVTRELTRLSVARTPRDRGLAKLREERMRALADAAASSSRTEEMEMWREYAEELEAAIAVLREDNARLTADLDDVLEELQDEQARRAAQDQELRFYRTSGATTAPGDYADETDLLGLEITDWAEFAHNVRRLESDAFRLTDEAVSALIDCEYAHCNRMWQFLVRLARVAEDYRAANGDLGGGLKQYALENHHIEISLHDQSLGNYTVTYEGVVLDAVPHVKVDDVKKPKECGRIYFAMDKDRRRFVVAHIGLHR